MPLRKGIRKARTARRRPTINDQQKQIDGHVEDGEASIKTECVTVGQIPVNSLYVKNLKCSGRYFLLSSGKHIAVAEFTGHGRLTKQYQILEVLTFYNPQREFCHILTCRCKSGCAQRERLLLTDHELRTEDITQFKETEEKSYCLHAKAVLYLDLKIQPVPETEDVLVDQLSTAPLLVGVHTDGIYGVVTKEQHNRKFRLRCLTCTTGVTGCKHVSEYYSWCKASDIHIELSLSDQATEHDQFDSCSYKKIPYPLPDDLKEVYDNYEKGHSQIPVDLVPTIEVENQCCHHGNPWDPRDPITQKWSRKKKAKIVKSATIIEDVSIYYRPTIGKCQCEMVFDGQDHLLFNLDDKYVFYYGFLFDYMHLMIEGRNPLAAYHRAWCRSNDVLSMTEVIPYDNLRRAWNSFARLLDIHFDEAFQCSTCKDKPEVIVCDATFLGCRKDLLPTIEATQPNANDIPLKGSLHKDRVFINDKKVRDLLLKFSGIDRKTRKVSTPVTEMSQEEFSVLLVRLKQKGHEGLASFIDSVVSDGGPSNSPPMYRKFFYELSHNSPLCGVFQIADHAECLDLIKCILDGTIVLTDSDRRCDLEILQSHAPIMAEFLASATKHGHLRFATRLIVDILSCISRPFEQSVVHSEDSYPPPTDSHLAFFPSLPKLHDDATYAANRDGGYRKDERMDCRKESYGHPTLSPGIFTIFCEHGVCYGFELMTSHESPRHPFSIFKTRFKTAPKCIIYDNACQLHKYCLNREPHFFKGTIFYVDRFHWKCHIGCSSGYCLDIYRTNLDIANINSQINEQANAGLKKLQAQLSYMSPSNFIFHVKFLLAVKNKDKSKRRQLCEMIEDLSLV